MFPDLFTEKSVGFRCEYISHMFQLVSCMSVCIQVPFIFGHFNRVQGHDINDVRLRCTTTGRRGILHPSTSYQWRASWRAAAAASSANRPVGNSLGDRPFYTKNGMEEWRSSCPTEHLHGKNAELENVVRLVWKI